MECAIRNATTCEGARRPVLDLAVLLNDTEDVARRLATKGTAESAVFQARDAVLARRAARSQLDDLRADMNRRSRESGRIIAQGGSEADQIREQLSVLKRRVAEAEAAFREAERQEREILLTLPNLPSQESPIGEDESSNVVLRYEGPAAAPDPNARPHWEVAADLGIFLPEKAAKISGAGFSLLRGDGARLLRALVQLGLDLHRDEYDELVVPHLVREDVMVGTGHLPKFRDEAYTTTLDGLWAVPTGEVPLTGLHRDEIIQGSDLPLKYMTYTACFRREAGSAGKDTRGMQRLHEFHKVELVHLCRPEDTAAQFEILLANAEKSLKVLELPYRVVELCTGDLTFSSARILDLEVYAPGVDRWLEVSSVGDFTDFQARRSNIRFRNPEGGTTHVGTLNGSAVATPRLWAAVLEHGQQPDGTVRVPEALQRYLGKPVIEPDPRRR